VKSKISNHDYELHLGGTAKPGIQKFWIPAVISCTYARRAASMKYAPTFYEYDALWPRPLQSNATWQHL
jgi:hypothetical protein